MSNHDFQNFRLKLDDAITYDGETEARRIAAEALAVASLKENLGEMMYFAAQLCMLDEDYEEAVRYLNKAIAANPQDGAAYNDLALCAAETGLLDTALVLFDRGIAVEPDFATIHHNKGWLLNQMGHHHKAIGCFRQALVLEPARAVTYENLADAYVHLRQILPAIEAYQKALILLKPDCSEIREQLKQRLSRLQAIIDNGPAPLA